MSAEPDIWVVYDGECPFCSNYVRLVRLRQAAGGASVQLVDARTDHPIVAEIRDKGLDLDEGMALKIGDRFYHGSEVMHQIALLTGPVGAFNRFNYWVFRNPRRAACLYPWLRAGRNATLRLLGRKKLSES